MTNDLTEDDGVPQTLVELIAENMAIYASLNAENMTFNPEVAIDDEFFIPHAEELLRRFRAIEGRDAADYEEVEEWSLRHINQKSGFFVLNSK